MRRSALVIPVALILLLAAETVWSASETPIQTVVRQQETWKGEVRIDGIVIVSKGGKLTIGPGTRIIFAPRDDDGDGIGDSELRIEGVLEVRGGKDDPVIFTSGASVPAAADWKYIMINHAGGAFVSNAVVEYAFSGIQVHYTRGTFSGIESRFNIDGFRFSTAPVTLENSILKANTNGIRFEERGAGAVIRNNHLIRNQVGIFAVIKCAGLTKFENNSIENNSDYAFKMGIQQKEDVPMKGNWWGSKDPGRISGSFFDGRREPGLGKVLFEPYLEEEPKFSAQCAGRSKY